MDRAAENRKRYGSTTHFYWDGKLHRRISVNRPANLLYAWSYEKHRRVAIVYSDWVKHKGIALSNNEVCELIGRHKTNVFRHLRLGHIPMPQATGERINSVMNRTNARLYWSEQDLMNLQEYLAGFATKPGGYFDTSVPTQAELRAKINNDVVFYVMSKDGEFVPTWKEADW